MNRSTHIIKPNLVAWAALLVAGLYAGFVLFPSYLNHDVSWILYSTRELINGGEFGRDIIDVNPPLVWWISMPPVFVAEMLNLSLVLSFRLYVLLLIALSMVLLMKTSDKITGSQIALAAMVLIVLPGYEFGQREHLMVILVTPYLASIMQRDKAPPRSQRVIVGILAGIGICLKPYFLLIPLCVEIYRAIKTRKIFSAIRPETVSMFVVGIVYVVLALIFAPAFFSDILPKALTSYIAYGNPLDLVAKSLFFKSIFAILAVFAFVFTGVRWGAGTAFLFAAFGAALAVLVQSKGWSYQVLPVSGFLLLAMCLSHVPHRKSFVYLAGLVLFVVAVAPLPARQAVQLSLADGEHSLVGKLSKRFSSLPDKQGKVFAFITSPRFIWPAMLDSNRRWAATQCCVYLLPAAVNSPENSNAQEFADRQLAEIVAKLEKDKPSLLVINNAKVQTGFRGNNFDYMGYLKQKKPYAGLFEQYRETGPIGHYRIFERITP